MALGVREEVVGCEKSGLDDLNLLSLGIGWLLQGAVSPGSASFGITENKRHD